MFSRNLFDVSLPGRHVVNMATIDLPKLLELTEEESTAIFNAVVESFLYKDLDVGIRQLIEDCNGKERAFFAGFVLGRLARRPMPEVD